MNEQDYREFFYYAMGCIESQEEWKEKGKGPSYEIFYKMLKEKQEELLNKIK